MAANLGGLRAPEHFDPEPMRGSPAGVTVATVGGRPITSGRSSSARNTMPDQYAKSCAAAVRAIPELSISKQSQTTLLPARRGDPEAITKRPPNAFPGDQ